MNAPPIVTAPEISEAEQKDLDAANAVREKAEQAALPYSWRQTLQDLSVSVPVPAGTKSKELNVVIKKKHITVQIKATKESLLEGELTKEIKLDDSTWTLGTLHLNTHTRRSKLTKNRCSRRRERNLDSSREAQPANLVERRRHRRPDDRHHQDQPGEFEAVRFGRRNESDGRENDV